MATDLKSIWFEAIREGFVSTVSRLLFSTPNPQVGATRLLWTLPAQVAIDYPEYCAERAREFCGPIEVGKVSALPYAMILMASDSENKARADLAANQEVIEMSWGNGNSPLHLAAVIGNKDLMKWILSKSSSLLNKNIHGNSAIDVANDEEIKNMIRDASCPESPAKLYESTSKTDKTTVEEEILKELGIDEHDEDAINLKRKILSESASATSPQLSPAKLDRPPMFTGSQKSTSSSPKLPQRTFVSTEAKTQPMELRGKSLVSNSPFLKSSPSKTTPEADSPSPTKFSSSFKQESLRDEVTKVKIVTLVTSTTQDEQPVPGNEGKQLEESVTVQNKQKEKEQADIIQSSFVTSPEGSLQETVADRTEQAVENEPEMKDDEITHSPTQMKNSFDFDFELELKRHLKQPVMVLLDREEKANSVKNVHFGNSWRGELEKTRKFFTNAASESVGRPAITSQTFIPLSSEPQKQSQFGKLYVNLISMRGLALNVSREPDSCHTYCIIRAGDKEVITRAIPVCLENLYTEMPIGEEFAFPTTGNVDIQVEMILKMEYDPQDKFDASKLFRRDSIKGMFKMDPATRKSSLRTEIPGETVERTLCTIKFRLTDILDKCQAAPLDRKWSWQVCEQTNDLHKNEKRPASRFERSLSRASSVSSKIFSGLKSKRHEKHLGEIDVDVSEAGILQMKVFYVGNLTDKADQDLLPNRTTQVIDWLFRKKWHDTFWISGYLSQTGGDIKHWRRRFYKVTGAKMEVFHEFTNEYRTTIDLRQVEELKRLPSEMDSESYATKNSFRLIFKHGESIDFYAENKEDFEKWTATLEQVCQNMPDSPEWLGEDSQTDCQTKADDVKVERRSPKKMSFDGSSGFPSTIAEDMAVNEEEYRPYDKRYKTPSAKASKASLLLKKKDPVYEEEGEEESYVADDTFVLGRDSNIAKSHSGSFVGVFGSRS